MENMGVYSEEHGERFHRNILDFEHRYHGQYNECMMGDYIGGLIRESDLKSIVGSPDKPCILTDLFTVCYHI